MMMIRIARVEKDLETEFGSESFRR